MPPNHTNASQNDLLVARYCQSLRNDIHRLTLDNNQLTQHNLALSKHINDLVKITHNQNQIIASQQQTLHQQLALMIAQHPPPNFAQPPTPIHNQNLAHIDNTHILAQNLPQPVQNLAHSDSADPEAEIEEIQPAPNFSQAQQQQPPRLRPALKPRFDFEPRPKFAPRR